MTHFLLVYRRSTGELVEDRDLGQDRAEALKVRFAREQREKDDPDVEVVLLSASSREALMQTHARYFKSVQQLAEGLADVTRELVLSR
jgi:hypothetical protein